MGVEWAWVVVAAMAATPEAMVVSPLVKVRPGVSPQGTRQARVSMARGECEGVQVVLPGAVRQLTVPPLFLSGPGVQLGASIWREGFLNVAVPSNSQGAKGAWPDAILPITAPMGPPGMPTVLYVEFCAPASQEPGTYQGNLRARLNAKDQVSVPFTVEVQPFVLPPTSSLPTSFGISGLSVARGHGLKTSSPEARALLREYARVLLEHRVSAHGMSMEPPPVRFEDGRAVIDWREYDAEMGPFLDGSLLPSGARFTTTDLRDNKKASTEEEKVAYYRAFAEHFRQKGWRADLFFYAKDEPKPQDVPLVLAQARRIHEAGGSRVLITTPLEGKLPSVADILAPTLNCFFPRPGPATCRSVHTVAETRKRLRPGTQVWWYQSCNSHGCNGGSSLEAAQERAYSGWASYMVDHSAMLNRAMGALAFVNGVDGELYFDTVFAYNTKKDPWNDLFEFGGNGDGTLFYPGTPARLGGSRHQPVTSLRLKHLRDGLEDFEYLRLLSRLGDEKFARDAARQLVRSGWDISQDAREWAQVRQVVTARLRQRWSTSEFAKRPGRHKPESTP